MGHPVDLRFVGSEMVLAPVFLGAEPAFSPAGRYAGVRAFDDETEVGLTFRRALTPAQEDRFLLSRTISSQDLPPELAGPSTAAILAVRAPTALCLCPKGLPAAN